MREEILRAVAQPPKVLWAPMVPSLINLGVQFPMMFISMGVSEAANPLYFVATIIIAHIALIGFGIKEPHLSTMLQAYGQTFKKTTNLYSVKGNKFEP